VSDVVDVKAPRWRSIADTRSVILYVLVGLCGFVVDFGLLVFCHEVVGAPVWLATSIGFWASLGVVFLANKYVTFNAPAHGAVQLVRYFLLLGFNYVATLGIVALAVSLGPGYQVGKVVAAGLIAVWNYLAYRAWVFR
jgi:putative flippase GtrA